jgi:hypothetical protein
MTQLDDSKNTGNTLDEILKELREQNYNSLWQEYCDEIEAKLTKYIEQEMKKAELYGRFHETIEAFQAGTIDADAYSKRHATLTEKIAKLRGESNK